jgi:hypothetical protein
MRQNVSWLLLVTLVSGMWGSWNNVGRVAAQGSNAVHLTISFDEAGIDALCADALNAYSPDINVVVSGDAGAYGPSIVVESGEASGIAPECQLSPGDALVLHLNRPAYAISFNRYGTVRVSLTNNGSSVGVANDVSSGLGGRYERTEFVGFDQVILAEDSGTTPLQIDEIEIVFESPAVTNSVDFNEVGFDRACIDAINTTPMLSATDNSTTDFAPPRTVGEFDSSFVGPICDFNPGNQLTINLPQPAIALSFDLYGGADLQLFLNGAQLGEAVDIQGLPTHYQRTTVGGFDQIVLTEPSGFSSFELDNLAVTFLVDGPVARIDFDGAAAGASCVDVIEAAGLDIAALAASSTDFATPVISDTYEAGATPACEFNPGNALTLTLPSTATSLSFTIYGGGEVQLLRSGEVIGAVNMVSGLPYHFARIEVEGFDTIIFTEPSGFSSFKMDNLQIVYED